MLDLKRRAAFADLRSVGEGEGVVAAEQTGFAAATLIARHGRSRELATAVAAAFGVELPTGPQWCGRSEVALLGTGVGKWLAICRSPSNHFVQRLSSTLPCAVIDQTDGIGIVRLSGPALMAALEKGVQVDLAPETFVPGCVAVTSIAHIGATIWKIDDAPIFDIAVARSVARSFQHWLEASAGVYGLTVLRRPQHN